MGVLRQAKTGRRHTLGARTIVGRSSRADLQLPHPSVSAEHAVIWWDAERWWIRDLGSRNGTRVEAESGNEAVALELGATLEFGAHPLAWIVESVAPAGARAVALGDKAVIEAVDGILALPNDTAAQLVIYGDPCSQWVLERGDEVRPIQDLAEVEVGGQRYRLHLPQVIASTVAVEDRPPSLDEIELRFTVSRDEEHVSLAMVGARGVIDLGSRSHHYTLLTLARARLADVELAESAQGWVYVDDLYEQLRLDREQLNMIVFRARKQLAAAGIGDARELVERRVDSSQLRLGVARITVEVA